jgi:hypothetical protein
MKVTNIIKIYEIDKQELSVGEDRVISVESHWNRNSMVVLNVEGRTVTVSAGDLEDAIANATNVNRY